MPCLMQVNGTDRESPPGWAGKAFGVPRAAALGPAPARFESVGAVLGRA